MVKIIKDKREKYEYIYNIFDYNDINYSIFFTHYKYLFNINPNYPKIRITPTLIERIINIEMIYNR